VLLLRPVACLGKKIKRLATVGKVQYFIVDACAQQILSYQLEMLPIVLGNKNDNIFSHTCSSLWMSR
jgi:hypothetical protein